MVFSPPGFISFTIPSIHNERHTTKHDHGGVELECRIYHPSHSHSHSHSPSPSRSPSSSPPTGPPRRSWRGAIIAHPYAPLGGCQDDPVVLSLVREILKGGDVVVATFNFRGAPGSKGSTTWTGTGELDDYVSVVGLMVHYLWHLRRQRLSRLDAAKIGTASNGEAEAEVEAQAQAGEIHLLLAGYSYGALITSRLPSVAEMLRPFVAPELGSECAEIRRRAEHLAERTGEAATGLNGRGASLSRHQQRVVRIGEEPQPPAIRLSHESSVRRSIDAVRRSLEHHHISRSLLSPHQSPPSVPSSTTIPPILPSSTLPDVKPVYILVSPVLGPVSGLLTLFKHYPSPASPSPSSFNLPLAQYPSLIVYGDQDGFTSARRVRRWCRDLALCASSDAAAASSPDPTFAASRSAVTESSGDQSRDAPVSADRHPAKVKGKRERECVTTREVAGAGHFWREEGAMAAMRTAVGTWVHAWTAE